MKAPGKNGDLEFSRMNEARQPADAGDTDFVDLSALFNALEAVESRGMAAPVMERIALYEKKRADRNRRVLEIGLCAGIAALTVAVMVALRLLLSGPAAELMLALLWRLVQTVVGGLLDNATTIALGTAAMTLMGIALFFREGKLRRR